MVSTPRRMREITSVPPGKSMSFRATPSKAVLEGSVMEQMPALPWFNVAIRCMWARSASCSIILVRISVLHAVLPMPSTWNVSMFR